MKDHVRLLLPEIGQHGIKRREVSVNSEMMAMRMAADFLLPNKTIN